MKRVVQFLLVVVTTFACREPTPPGAGLAILVDSARFEVFTSFHVTIANPSPSPVQLARCGPTGYVEILAEQSGPQGWVSRNEPSCGNCADTKSLSTSSSCGPGWSAVILEPGAVLIESTGVPTIGTYRLRVPIFVNNKRFAKSDAASASFYIW